MPKGVMAIALLLAHSEVGATDFVRREVPKPESDSWSTLFPNVEWYPQVGNLKPIEVIPEDIRGKWFRVKSLREAKPDISEAWVEVGKLSEQSLVYKIDPVEVISVESDGKIVVTHRRDGSGEVIRRLGNGLIVVNLFREKDRAFCGRPDTYAVK